MLKKVRVEIKTTLYELKGSLFDTSDASLPEEAANPLEAPQKTEMLTDASYHDDGHRVCIRYKESELSGMEGSTASVSFQKNNR